MSMSRKKHRCDPQQRRRAPMKSLPPTDPVEYRRWLLERSGQGILKSAKQWIEKKGHARLVVLVLDGNKDDLARSLQEVCSIPPAPCAELVAVAALCLDFVLERVAPALDSELAATLRHPIPGFVPVVVVARGGSTCCLTWLEVIDGNPSRSAVTID